MKTRYLLPGIIGGAGPRATAQLYLDILTRCQKGGVPHRPSILIASLEIDRTIEAELLRTGSGIEAYSDALHLAARQLSEGGADFLAIPCNTLHVLLPELTRSTKVPIISILDTAVAALKGTGATCVGLLATGTTRASGLYQDAMSEAGLRVLEPPDAIQQELQSQILAEIHEPDKARSAAFCDRAGTYFQTHGADAVLAGCTELKAILAGWSSPIPLIDSLDALGASVAHKILSENGVPRV